MAVRLVRRAVIGSMVASRPHRGQDRRHALAWIGPATTLPTVVTQAARRVDGWLSDIPFYPWLFAAFPVVRLYAREPHRRRTRPRSSLPLLVVLVATVGMLVLARLLRDARRAAIIVAAVLVPCSRSGSSWSCCRPRWSGAVPAAGPDRRGVIARHRRRSARQGPARRHHVGAQRPLARAARRGGHPGGPGRRRRAAHRRRPIEDPAPEVVAATAGATAGRDIYHLILDRYGSERSFETGFGIDNSEFVAWLREQGFQVARRRPRQLRAGRPCRWAPRWACPMLDDIAADGRTRKSQNLAPVDAADLPRAAPEPSSRTSATSTSTSAPGSSRHATRASRTEVVPPGAGDRRSRRSLYDLTVVAHAPGPARTPRPAMPRTTPPRGPLSSSSQLDELRDDPGPKYVLAHLLLPHPPYVFLEDGSVRARRGHAPEPADLHQREPQGASWSRSWRCPRTSGPSSSSRPMRGPIRRRVARPRVGFDWDTATDEELITKFGILDAWLMPGPEGAGPVAART